MASVPLRQTSQGINNAQSNQVQCTKVIRDGQIFILRGDKTYTLQGQKVKYTFVTFYSFLLAAHDALTGRIRHDSLPPAINTECYKIAGNLCILRK